MQAVRPGARPAAIYFIYAIVVFVVVLVLVVVVCVSKLSTSIGLCTVIDY